MTCNERKYRNTLIIRSALKVRKEVSFEPVTSFEKIEVRMRTDIVTTRRSNVFQRSLHIAKAIITVLQPR